MRRTDQKKYFELILTWRLDIPQRASEFRVICIIAELMQPEVARPENLSSNYGTF